MLAVSTCLRQAELLGLKWPDIELDSSRQSVCRTLVQIKGKLPEGESKPAKRKRQLSLWDVAVEAQREHRKRMPAEGNAGSTYVFCDSVGGPLIKANLNLSFKRLVKRARVPQIRVHDMSHTNGTMLLPGGMHLKAVHERLGHSQSG